MLGASIGSGEFLLGPAVFVKHGLSLLWITVVAVILQTIFNTEVMRYTLATGEPMFTGFMRTRPSSTLWAWTYVGLVFPAVRLAGLRRNCCRGHFLSRRGPPAGVRRRDVDLLHRRVALFWSAPLC